MRWELLGAWAIWNRAFHTCPSLRRFFSDACRRNRFGVVSLRPREHPETPPTSFIFLYEQLLINESGAVLRILRISRQLVEPFSHNARRRVPKIQSKRKAYCPVLLNVTGTWLSVPTKDHGQRPFDLISKYAERV